MFGFSTIKLVVIGIVIASILGYIGYLKYEVHSLTADLHDEKVAFEAYRVTEEGMQTALKSRAAALTLQAKEALINQWKAEEARTVAIRERIKNDAAAKAIVVPRSVIGVLNDSATAPSGHTGGITLPKQGNDAGASPAKASDEVFSLQDIEATAVDNNAEHWKCIDQVHAWWKFWKTFSEGVSVVAQEAGK